METFFRKQNLDERLLKTLKEMKIKTPTEIQQNTLKPALRGKDILAHAPTGSGKTLAYCVPLVQRMAECSKIVPGVFAVVFVPTKDLVVQTAAVLKSLLLHFPQFAVVELADEEEKTAHAHPTVLVTTPSSSHRWLHDNTALVKNVKIVVVDEADVLLETPRAQKIERATAFLPRSFQTFFASATLNMETERVFSYFFPKGVSEISIGEKKIRLKHLALVCEQKEKFLLLYAIIKTNLLEGRFLVFTKFIDTAYKIFLFLQAFGESVCVINPEMPLNIRTKKVVEFNRGKYTHGIIPAIDHLQDAGLYRGVDFKKVDVVLNFDCPDSPTKYTHYVGRTARGGQKGTALTFVTSSDEGNFSAIKENTGEIDSLPVDKEALGSFSYRVGDVLSKLTKIHIQEFRVAEVKKELLGAEELKMHFRSHDIDTEELSKNTAEKAASTTTGVAEYLVKKQTA
ncbi:MAG: ATP-dependent RNA helicase Dbp9 [Amphiamblys sp. WSBS2006]|nr:MAG: ATP-dependent RNA helicase Dbp9 [Amphiamblys sp. WSBS2006]